MILSKIATQVHVQGGGEASGAVRQPGFRRLMIVRRCCNAPPPPLLDLRRFDSTPMATVMKRRRTTGERITSTYLVLGYVGRHGSDAKGFLHAY